MLGVGVVLAAVVAIGARAGMYTGTITDSSSYHYDTYSEVNSSGSSACATITVQANAAAGSFGVAAYAYLGSFDPNNLATNYAGGVNSQVPVGGSATYHVTVPAGQTLVAEVEEYVAGSGASYTLTIDMAPTAVLIRSASAKRTSRGVAVRWRTGQETDLVGFRLKRRTAGRTVRVGPSIIRAVGGVGGHSYTRLDRSAPLGRVVYRLEAVTRDGSAHFVAAFVARV